MEKVYVVIHQWKMILELVWKDEIVSICATKQIAEKEKIKLLKKYENSIFENQFVIKEMKVIYE